jgi:hypothetical protein
VASTFAQRFEFARDRQRGLGTWQDDSALAIHLGVASSSITEYKTRDEAPPAKRTLAIARICGVDPGWLAFGEDSGAPRPDGFAFWLENRRKAQPQLTVDKSAPPPPPPTSAAAANLKQAAAKKIGKAAARKKASGNR